MTNDELLNALGVTSTPAEEYRHLTKGGEHKVSLSRDEECVILKTHDYGVDSLTQEDKDLLHSIVGQLKSSIWP